MSRLTLTSSFVCLPSVHRKPKNGRLNSSLSGTAMLPWRRRWRNQGGVLMSGRSNWGSMMRKLKLPRPRYQNHLYCCYYCNYHLYYCYYCDCPWWANCSHRTIDQSIWSLYSSGHHSWQTWMLMLLNWMKLERDWRN